MLSLYNICPRQHKEYIAFNELSVGDLSIWKKGRLSSFKGTGKHHVLKYNFTFTRRKYLSFITTLKVL